LISEVFECLHAIQTKSLEKGSVSRVIDCWTQGKTGADYLVCMRHWIHIDIDLLSDNSYNLSVMEKEIGQNLFGYAKLGRVNDDWLHDNLLN